MTDNQPHIPIDVELDAIRAAQGFLLESLLILICEAGLAPQAKFLSIGSSLLEIIRRRVADPLPKDTRAVQVSEEAERQLKIFLARVCVRMKIPLELLFHQDLPPRQ